MPLLSSGELQWRFELQPNQTYAQTMDYGDELKGTATHLQALLEEGRRRDGVVMTGEQYVAEMSQRDFAIARCALILAHRKLNDDADVVRTDPDWKLIEGALEWLFRA